MTWAGVAGATCSRRVLVVAPSVKKNNVAQAATSALPRVHHCRQSSRSQTKLQQQSVRVKMTTPVSPKRIGPLAQAWFKWKALRLPWRRQFLVGFDLNGNTYWEFRVAGGARTERLRRIVKYPRSTHLSDIRISPQWHQWLRYTRFDPPSVSEQRQDVVRQVQMKQLAAEADARWEAKPRVMDAPEGQAAPSLGGGETTETQPEASHRASEPSSAGKTKSEAQEDPWAQAKARGPGEKWQPEAWTPPAGKK